MKLYAYTMHKQVGTSLKEEEEEYMQEEEEQE